MVATSLSDRLTLQTTDDLSGAIRLRVVPPAGTDGQSVWSIPSDATNLVVKALEAVRAKALQHPMLLPSSEESLKSGLDVVLFKGIPAMAGLGGGSSDAAAAIVGGFAAWGIPWDRKIAGMIAASLGSDINFFLESCHDVSLGKISTPLPWAARCFKRGEVVEPVQVGSRFDIVIVQPPEGCSTAKVFQGLTLPKEIRNAEDTLVALAHGNVPQLGRLLFNRLELPAMAESPWIEKIRNAIPVDGVAGHGMSGSGSARFVLCNNYQIALTVSKRLRSELPVSAFAASSWHAPSIESQLRFLGATIRE